MEVVNLTSNVCINGKFTGEAEIGKMIKHVESDCKFRPKTKANELFCEVVLRCGFGFCCIIGSETNITTRGQRIVSSDYQRVQRLEISYYGTELMVRGDFMENIRFLPMANDFLRGLIEYRVYGTRIKSISRENFDEMIWLESLDLSHNSVETIPKNAFLGLLRLQYISLSENYTFLFKLA